MVQKVTGSIDWTDNKSLELANSRPNLTVNAMIASCLCYHDAIALLNTKLVVR